MSQDLVGMTKMVTMPVVTEQDIIDLLKAERQQGYATGREKIKGSLPGSKTFPSFFSKDGRFSVTDTYWGKRESGGFYLICTEQPERKDYMLIQYGGGSRSDLTDEEAGSVNDFLKQALSNRENTRLPHQRGTKLPWIEYTEEGSSLAYLGFPTGNAFNLSWLEGILDTGSELANDWRDQFGLDPKDPLVGPLEYLIEAAESIFALGTTPNLVFYHDLKHRMLR